MEQPVTNAEYAYRNLRQKILYGELKPGERLLITDLSQQLGISNSPLIEALRRLEQDGLVVSRPHAGAQVQKWSLHDVVHSYLTREAVDGMAARMFVDCATGEQRDKLVQLQESYRQAARSKDAPRLNEADTAYHLHIIRCTLPLPMQKAMETIYAITMTPLINKPNLSQMLVEGTHDEMTNLLLGDDPIAAEEYIRDSMRRVLSELIASGIIGAEDVPASIELGDVLVGAPN